MSAIKYDRVDVDGFGVAYRESGPADGPMLLLLHGFPSSSHMGLKLWTIYGPMQPEDVAEFEYRVLSKR